MNTNEYDLWKDSQLKYIKTDYIDDQYYILHNKAFFDKWTIHIMNKYKKEDKMKYKKTKKLSYQ